MIRVTVEHGDGHKDFQTLGEIEIVREEQITMLTHEYSVLLTSQEHGEIDTEVRHIRSHGWLQLVDEAVHQLLREIDNQNTRTGEYYDELKNT